MKPKLEQIDAAAQQVALDLWQLNRSMQNDDPSTVKRRADALRAHAARLRRLSNGIARTIRGLTDRERRGVVRTYFQLLLGVLSHQHAEGQALQRLARLTWRDPLITTTPDVQRLSRLVTATRRDAREAVTLAARAAALRRQHRRAFRYIRPQSST
jgi:hypothetical protein